jgi:hypothetical protein
MGMYVYFSPLRSDNADSQKIRKVVKILSGDPSRGALALETEAPLSVGQEIQVSPRPLLLDYD